MRTSSLPAANPRGAFGARIRVPLLIAIGVLLACELIVRIEDIPSYLLPPPSRVLIALVENRDLLLFHFGVTLSEALLGFLAAIVLGVGSGSLFVAVPVLQRALLPYAIASQAVPIVAVAPLFILWFGSGLGSKVAMSALVCFFPLVIGTTRGLESVHPDLLALMRVYGAGKAQVFWKLLYPTSVRQIIGAMKVSASLAMIGAIVAEYAGADSGLGYVIMQSTYRLDTVWLFSGIVFAALGGWLIFGLVIFVERFLLAKYR